MGKLAAIKLAKKEIILLGKPSKLTRMQIVIGGFD